MKSKASLDFLTRLEMLRQYYKNYKEANVKTEQEFELAEQVEKDMERLILLFVKALAE